MVRTRPRQYVNMDQGYTQRGYVKKARHHNEKQTTGNMHTDKRNSTSLQEYGRLY
jgi:hypothetical protein